MTILGVLCFPIGRLFAKISFRTDKFPFRQTEFEKNSRLYEKIKIRKWQNKLPDVSQLTSGIVPRKSMEGIVLDARSAKVMVNETCVAELTHVMLCFLGITLLFIWPGVGGVILFLAYVFLGNFPFILIQRYNRPRLSKVRDALLKKEQKTSESRIPQAITKENGIDFYENAYIEL